jgi:epsilon-lactone hydrolase
MGLITILLHALLGLIIIIEPIIEQQRFFVAQSVRMQMIHTIFTIRQSCLSVLQTSMHPSSEYQALEAIVRLSHPPFYLRSKANYSEVVRFRQTAKERLRSFWPRRHETCQFNQLRFDDGDQQALAYSIRAATNDEWKVKNQQVLLYIHGGGFVFGDFQLYSGYECYLSREYNVTVIHVEYRLVPEHSIQSAIDDVVTVYKSMLTADPDIHQRLIGMSDSSGSLLWLRLIQILVADGLPCPRALILHSPWVDFSFADIVFDRHSQQKRLLYTLELLIHLRQQAMPGLGFIVGMQIPNDYTPRLKQINPVEYSFRGFPPIYVTVGTEEVCYTDALLLEGLIRDNHGQITIEKGNGLMHTYSMFHLWAPEARTSQKSIRRFIQSLRM